jgi:hypothetical protein
MTKTERRTNYALRRRIDQLIGRVREARAEIVERGLDAVHETHEPPVDADAAPATGEPIARRDDAAPAGGEPIARRDDAQP